MIFIAERNALFFEGLSYDVSGAPLRAKLFWPRFHSLDRAQRHLRSFGEIALFPVQKGARDSDLYGRQHRLGLFHAVHDRTDDRRHDSARHTAADKLTNQRSDVDTPSATG